MDTRVKLLNYIIECLKEYKGIEVLETPVHQFNDEEIAEIKRIAERNNLISILVETGNDFWTKISGCSQNNDTRNLYKARIQLAMPILEEFEKENIEYALLKGAYLADIAYGNMNIRGSNDVDILISKKDIKKVKDICLANGFVPGKSNRKDKIHPPPI